MKNIYREIKKKIESAFSPFYLLVLNISNQHHIFQRQKRETHFKVILVSEKFSLQNNMVMRHKAVYQLLSDELNAIHSLSLHTYTLNEWKQFQKRSFSLPPCFAGKQK